MNIQTVNGPIAPEELGPTLMHEHVMADFTPPERRDEPDADITLETVWQINLDWVDTPGVRRLTDPDIALREMHRLKADGGQAVVEVSTPGMLFDPQGLRDLSRNSGITIVKGYGRYLDEFMTPEDRERDIDDLAGEFVDSLRVGIDGSEIKAGLIGEIGCSWPLTEPERRSVVAAAVAQQETGALVSIHPGRAPEGPFQAVDILRENGADLERTVMCHIERRLFDAESILRLADTGVTIELDLFGWESSFFAQGRDVVLSSDGARLDWIEALLGAGHRDRIVVSQDICQKTRMASCGGHGYGHIFRNVVPMMRRRGIADADIDAILVDNPARLLARNLER